MRKLFLFLLAIALFSCSGELYEDEIVVKDGLAYKKDSNSPYSGSVVDQYGETVGAYKKGLKDGQWEEKNFEKGTQKVANYIMGVPDGEQVTFVHPGRQEKSKRLEYINYENGQPVGVWTQWGRDSENRIKKSGEIVFENGSGRWREWDLNTRAVIRAGDYENWKKVNIWKSWDANEVLVSEGKYVDGKKEGKWTWYDEGEDTGWEENYIVGTLEGKFYNLSPYAPDRGKGLYKDGIKTGEWEEYFIIEEGSLALKQSGPYQLGKKEGAWAHYKKEDSSIVESNIYKSRKIAAGPYSQDAKTGEWTEGEDIDFGSRFYGKGQYKNNKKTGEWNYIGPQENPTIKGSFTDGEASGEWEVRYNKKKYKGTLEDLKKKVPGLNEYRL